MNEGPKKKPKLKWNKNMKMDEALSFIFNA